MLIVNTKRSHMVIIGGLYEAESLFDEVAETAIGLEMADDIVVFTLNDAINKQENKLKIAVKGAHQILTHGAGVLAIPTSEELGVVTLIAPQEIPEAKRHHTLMEKSINHLRGDGARPLFDHFRVVGTNFATAAAHPYRNRQLGSFAAAFSTYEFIQEKQLPSDIVGYFPMREDEYFGPADEARLTDLELWGTTVAVLEGKHDELLTDPNTILTNVQAITRTSMSQMWARQGTVQ